MSVRWHQKSNNKVDESFAHIEFNASLTISSTNCPKSANIHITMWMQSNRLQLNTAKTEIGDDYITPAASVRDPGIYIDSDVSMKSHVSRTVSTCFAALRQIRNIRHC